MNKAIFTKNTKSDEIVVEHISICMTMYSKVIVIEK